MSFKFILGTHLVGGVKITKMINILVQSIVAERNHETPKTFKYSNSTTLVGVGEHNRK